MDLASQMGPDNCALAPLRDWADTMSACMVGGVNPQVRLLPPPPSMPAPIGRTALLQVNSGWPAADRGRLAVRQWQSADN